MAESHALLITEIAELRANNAKSQAELAALRIVARVGIELDNHHNAARCPYCIPTLESDVAEVRQARQQAEAAYRSGYADGTGSLRPIDEAWTRYRASLTPKEDDRG